MEWSANFVYLCSLASSLLYVHKTGYGPESSCMHTSDFVRLHDDLLPALLLRACERWKAVVRRFVFSGKGGHVL